VVLGPDVFHLDTSPHPIQGGEEMGWSEIDKITFMTRQLYPADLTVSFSRNLIISALINAPEYH